MLLLAEEEYQKALAEHCWRTKLVDVDVQVEPQLRGLVQFTADECRSHRFTLAEGCLQPH